MWVSYKPTRQWLQREFQMGMSLEGILEELRMFKETVKYYLEVNNLSSDDVEDCLEDLEDSLKDAKFDDSF
jgi:hypothetical protein